MSQLNASQPIVFPDMTMTYHFRDFLNGLSFLADSSDVVTLALRVTALEGEMDAVETAIAALSTTVEISGDYTTTGNYNHETVICNNSSAITVTLQSLNLGDKVTIIRGNGAVTINGGGSTVVGSSTHSLATRYDAASLTASSSEWLLS